MPFCPDTALDPLGHHAVICRHGGDVVICHYRQRDEAFDLCCCAHLSIRLENGHGLTRDLDHTRPADILIAGWDRERPSALDITITSQPSWVSRVTRLVQKPLQQRHVSSTPNARSWAGPAFHCRWRHMAIGARRLRIPSPDWHPTWPFTSPPHCHQCWPRFMPVEYGSDLLHC